MAWRADQAASLPDNAHPFGAVLCGVGLTFPVLGAAAVASLHSSRFAVGSAVNQTARQVGGALGVAILVAILATTDSPVAALAHFRHPWTFSAAMAVLAGGIVAFLRPQRDLVLEPPRPATVVSVAPALGDAGAES